MKVASPVHMNPDSQTVPESSVQVSLTLSKSSVVLPSGRMNRLSGIERVFCSAFCVYVIFMFPWKCPGIFGSNVIVKFFTSRADMFSISSVLMNVKSDVIWMFVSGSSPKLNSSIVSSDSVFVNNSARRSSGFCRRSSCVDGDSNVAFADRYIIGIENSLYVDMFM